MADRLRLHEALCSVLGTTHVYYQPPESVKMIYPAIRYSLLKINIRYAAGSLYKKMKGYQLILIDKNPDSEFVDQLISLPYCSFDRQYVSDNLNHFVFTIYY